MKQAVGILSLLIILVSNLFWNEFQAKTNERVVNYNVDFSPNRFKNTKNSNNDTVVKTGIASFTTGNEISLRILPYQDLHSDSILQIGSDRQLFLDNFLIAASENIQMKKHDPIPQEVVLYFDKPWEGESSWCPTVIKDENIYRVWYRSQGTGEPDHGDSDHSFTSYAESRDGKQWNRPDLGLFEFEGSGANNICINNPDLKNFSVFRDANPVAPTAEKYKAVGRWTKGKPSRIYGMISDDGINWKPVQKEPLIIATENDPQFDSPLNAFWDNLRKVYVIYVRGWYPDGLSRRVRSIRMSSSPDFLHWSDWEYIKIDGEKEWPAELYTNSAHPYYRAPLILMFPKRFIPERKYFSEWPYKGLSDVLFMFSRDGVNFAFPYMEPFLTPGIDLNNWHDRAIYVAPSIVKTGEGEMSFYTVMNYRTSGIHLQRFSMREDGFVSLHTTSDKGVLTTKPFIFNGNSLEINFSTSAAGYVKIEILTENGKNINGFSGSVSEEIFGDRISHIITWDGKHDLSGIERKPVRLKFHMMEADIYSFRFFYQ